MAQTGLNRFSFAPGIQLDYTSQPPLCLGLLAEEANGVWVEAMTAMPRPDPWKRLCHSVLTLFSAGTMQKIQQGIPQETAQNGAERSEWKSQLSHLKLCDLGQVTSLPELSFLLYKQGIMTVPFL